MKFIYAFLTKDGPLRLSAIRASSAALSAQLFIGAASDSASTDEALRPATILSNTDLILLCTRLELLLPSGGVTPTLVLIKSICDPKRPILGILALLAMSPNS